MKIRRPAVAGMFYHGTAAGLKSQVEGCFQGGLGPGKVPDVSPKPLEGLPGLVVPHAGLMYSGYAAAHSYAELATHGRPDLAIIIGPNHTGYGDPVATMAEGIWQTPLGEVEIDSDAARQLMKRCPLVADNSLAHHSEHSLEVQLPFLQYLYGNQFGLLPIVLGVSPMEEEAWPVAQELGAALADLMSGCKAVLLASTDFTHYESKESAAAKDRHALRAIQDLDPQKLLSAVRQHNITMCGALPTATTLVACKTLGARSARLLTYYCSGDVIGDPHQVVAYGALAIQSSQGCS